MRRPLPALGADAFPAWAKPFAAHPATAAAGLPARTCTLHAPSSFLAAIALCHFLPPWFVCQVRVRAKALTRIPLLLRLELGEAILNLFQGVLHISCLCLEHLHFGFLVHRG